MILFGRVLWHINHCRLFNAKSSLYTYIKYMVWLGGIVWLINHCELVNVKSSLYIYIYIYIYIYDLVWFAYQPCWLFNDIPSLYIYIKYIGFGLVWFYGISTIVGYLMPYPVFTYISNIWFVNAFFRYTQLMAQTVLFRTIQFSINQ